MCHTIPDLTRHTETAEIIASSFLRELLPVNDGDEVRLIISDPNSQSNSNISLISTNAMFSILNALGSVSQRVVLLQ